MIILKHRVFHASARSLEDCPPPTLSEAVILGRSNVGKSTFINMLLESSLAKSSSTPGKTRLINFFATRWYESETNTELPFMLVDLPGIGYAKVSKVQQEQWAHNMWHFLRHRSSIKLFLHLIDSRHTNLASDIKLDSSIKNILCEDQKLLKIYTKADKLTKNNLAKLQTHANKEHALIVSNVALNIKHGKQNYVKEVQPKSIDIVRLAIFQALLGYK